MSSRFASGRGVRKCWESVFHVLNFDVLPTPIFTIIFSQAPQNEGELPKIAQNARIAFCGNGFIHLNIAEIHEDDIGGQKTCAYFANQGSKWGILLGRGLRAV